MAVLPNGGGGAGTRSLTTQKTTGPLGTGFDASARSTFTSRAVTKRGLSSNESTSNHMSSIRRYADQWPLKFTTIPQGLLVSMSPGDSISAPTLFSAA
eukprot:CAMPEP_0117587818 /NCGR_PEP_ID=MMETSP0784-20121206/69511_1 /TAXON_ID=39447 /ORGANISM="" /LENGTH=97 /DNA_ID=CAMNT_0005389117 /DNA_START=267 /DNA_END=560 /DNA_ORIENTATION=-